MTKKPIIIFTSNILFSIFYFYSLNLFLHFLHHHYKRRHRNQFALASSDWNFNTSKSKEMIQDDEAMIQKWKTLKNCKFWQWDNIYFSIHQNFRKFNQHWQVAFQQKCEFWKRKIECKNLISSFKLHQRRRLKTCVKTNNNERNMKSFDQQIHEEASDNKTTILDKVHELQEVFWYVN